MEDGTVLCHLLDVGREELSVVYMYLCMHVRTIMRMIQGIILCVLLVMSLRRPYESLEILRAKI